MSVLEIFGIAILAQPTLNVPDAQLGALPQEFKKSHHDRASALSSGVAVDNVVQVEVPTIQI